MNPAKTIRTTELKPSLFAPYGRLLVPGAGEDPVQAENGVFAFFVPFSEPSHGWQIGYLEYTGKVLEQLECHPNTPEVFSPLRGQAILVLATDPGKEGEYRAFKLEKPIVLNAGVWHGVITLTEKSEMLIVENPDVVDKYFKLSQAITGKTS